MTSLARFWRDWSTPFGVTAPARWSKTEIRLLCFGLTVLVLLVDEALGRQFTTAMFYSLPILLLAWLDTGISALVLALATFFLWELLALHQGRTAANWIIWINGVFRLAIHFLFIAIMVRLKQLQANLRSLAEERALALAQEAARNIRLEREMLEVGEREQRRIGQDLHDGLCQHLTGTALTGQALVESLGDSQAGHDARRLVELLEEGVGLTRKIAKGLYPIEMADDGLMHGLEELSAKIQHMFGVDCRFSCGAPVLVDNTNSAANLYRIAQEAVSNALRHGRASRIEIALEEVDNDILLRISDNGCGLPKPLPDNGGMGLHIMAERARSIGGKFLIQQALRGGTEAVCVAPAQQLFKGQGYAGNG